MNGPLFEMNPEKIVSAAAEAAVNATLDILRPQIQELHNELTTLSNMVRQLEEALSQHVAESAESQFGRGQYVENPYIGEDGDEIQIKDTISHTGTDHSHAMPSWPGPGAPVNQDGMGISR